MKDVIILDNSPVAYMFQPENAMPILSWYDDMTDRELPRIGNILERMAYEEDVRKIIRQLIANNDIDQKAEQIYLHSKQRDHSQRVQDRTNGSGPQNPRKQNSRYESADNRQKHTAIIDEQMKKKLRGGEEENAPEMILLQN